MTREERLAFCMYCGDRGSCKICTPYRKVCEDYQTERVEKTLTELGQENTYKGKDGNIVEFGWINEKWETFKAFWQEGDELWSFYYPGTCLDMRAGYCIKRGDEIIDFFITALS